MSDKYPIISITGSSGAGTSTVKTAMQHIFHREAIHATVVEGDSFHRYDRAGMRTAIAEFAAQGKTLSHFGPDANLFAELESMFEEYGKTGTGKTRLYLHNEMEAAPFHQEPGTFTPWDSIDPKSDLLFYEGLHGGVVTNEVNIAQHVDLLIGVVPVVNLEWIQKIHRDSNERGYSAEAIVETILRRMPDYVHYITPQFSKTDINFQRVALVDTSNPFIARDIPTPDESVIIVRFREPEKVDFPYLLQMIKNSYMTRRNNIVIPGARMGLAMEIILTPLIHKLVQRKLLAG